MSGPDWSRLVPVNVVTGFLGSGKTTLLRRLLASPRLASCAVLVNEFGEVGLDHHLLEAVTGSMVLLDNGCVCCAVRDDLRGALLELHGRRERGEVPRYDRVVIESSGLADPAPVLHTLTADPVLRHHYRPGAVVTVVDALHGSAQLDRYPESVKQAALADRMILTKTDLAEPEAARALEARLRAMNPAAPIRRAAAPATAPAPGGATGGEEAGAFDAAALLMEDAHRADSRRAEAERWLGLDGGRRGPAGGGLRPSRSPRRRRWRRRRRGARERRVPGRIPGGRGGRPRAGGVRPARPHRRRHLVPDRDRRAHRLDGVRDLARDAPPPARRGHPARQGHRRRARARRPGPPQRGPAHGPSSDPPPGVAPHVGAGGGRRRPAARHPHRVHRARSRTGSDRALSGSVPGIATGTTSSHRSWVLIRLEFERSAIRRSDWPEA